MTYKDTLIGENLKLCSHPKVRFIGYNVAFGPQFHGTLNLCPRQSLIEMPCAENLIMGAGIGLAIQGWRPIVCFERMDFLLSCMDSIINHLCRLPGLSGEQFSIPLIIKTCVGTDTPLDPGPQHVQNYVQMFDPYMDVRDIRSVEAIRNCYEEALTTTHPMMLVEHRELYNIEEKGAI